MRARCSEAARVNNGMCVDLELMCTWCPAGVMCDLPISRCVSGLGMYPCCRCAMTVGSVVRVRGVLVAPFVRILFIIFIIIGSLR